MSTDYNPGAFLGAMTPDVVGDAQTAQTNGMALGQKMATINALRGINTNNPQSVDAGIQNLIHVGALDQASSALNLGYQRYVIGARQHGISSLFNALQGTGSSAGGDMSQPDQGQGAPQQPQTPDAQAQQRAVITFGKQSADQLATVAAQGDPAKTAAAAAQIKAQGVQMGIPEGFLDSALQITGDPKADATHFQGLSANYGQWLDHPTMGGQGTGAQPDLHPTTMGFVNSGDMYSHPGVRQGVAMLAATGMDTKALTEALTAGRETGLASPGQVVVNNGVPTYQAPYAPVDLAPGHPLVNPNNGQTIASAPFEPTLSALPPGNKPEVFNPNAALGPASATPPPQPGPSGTTIAPAGVGNLPAVAQSYAAQIQSRPSFQALSPSDQQTLLAIGYSESGLNPNGPPNGKHAGPFQFDPNTFAHMGGTNIADPAQQADAAANLLTVNKSALAKAGIQASPSDIYLAAMQGPAGATALLKASQGETAVGALEKTGVSPTVAVESIAGNLGLPYKTAAQRQAANAKASSMTAQDFVGLWQQRFSDTLGKVSGTTASAGEAAPSSVDNSLPGLSIGSAAPAYGPVTSVPGVPGLAQVGADNQVHPVANTSPTASEVFGLRGKTMDSGEYKAAQAGLSAWQAMTKIAPQMTGPAAYTILDNFARAINPPGMARPTTIRAIVDTLGLPNQVAGAIEGAGGQGPLTPQARQQIMDAVYENVASHYAQAKQQNDFNAQYVSQHPEFGVKPQDVVAPLAPMPNHFLLVAPPPAQRVVGQVYDTPKGPHKWTGAGWQTVQP